MNCAFLEGSTRDPFPLGLPCHVPVTPDNVTSLGRRNIIDEAGQESKGTAVCLARGRRPAVNDARQRSPARVSPDAILRHRPDGAWMPSATVYYFPPGIDADPPVNPKAAVGSECRLTLPIADFPQRPHPGLVTTSNMLKPTRPGHSSSGALIRRYLSGYS